MSLRIAVAGAGVFGRHHLRVLQAMEGVELTGVFDTDRERAEGIAASHGIRAFESLDELAGANDAATIAAPTTAHAAAGCQLLNAGLDVLIEKPIAPTLEEADRLIEAAARNNRLLQVGHLERFNPAVEALAAKITMPLFFEIHRLSLFTPRSLDVDVVLDLMIHDIDIVLALTGALPEEVRAAGISILSEKVDIANVRLAFPGGCVANLTASRVSTERVRKVRLFQPHEYLSIDYADQKGVAFHVSPDKQIGFSPFAVTKDEPLRRELAHFIDSVTHRTRPRVDGMEARRALAVALEILAKIEAHGEVIADTLAKRAME
ncbi:MAG: Gfo/Idh/MocA family oxidoreductase [Acidobacteria bacterium]|nr:Gfo/Idh/MocA family oxidoreductase [Acidobacteriota bacterium]